MPSVPIRRGAVVYVDLSGAVGVEKQRTRPCIVVQNNGGNKASPMTIVAPITDEDQYKGYSQQVIVDATNWVPTGSGPSSSVVIFGQSIAIAGLTRTEV